MRLNHHITAAVLAVWCEVTNACMWITAFLAFYNQVSTMVAIQISPTLQVVV